MPESAESDLAPAESAQATRRWTFVPWALLAVFLALSVMIARGFHDRIDRVFKQRFNALAEQIELAVAQRIDTYIQVVRGAQGLWRSNPDVDAAAWRRYVDTLHLEHNFAGIQGIGLVKLESGANGPRAVVRLLEPLTERNQLILGYDMYAEPVRRAAMERARDTGAPAVSGRVHLLPDDGTTRVGFVLYLPLYRGMPRTLEERRAQLVGFVYAPFNSKEVMRNTLGYRGLYVQYSVHDGDATTNDTLLFHSDQPPGEVLPLVRKMPVVIGGRGWTVVSRAGPDLTTAADPALPIFIGLGGAVIAVLMAGLALALVRTRERAAIMAQRMTADLQHRERQLQEISTQLSRSNEDLQQFAYAASHDLKEPLRSIAGSLGLLVRRYTPQLDDSAREFLGFASEGAQRLSGLIDSLLDYSRVNTHAGPLTPVALDEVLDTALRNLQHLITESGAQIDRSPLPHVLADRDQLVRVMQNLIGNAIKYSRRKEARPYVQIHVRTEGAQWAIGISDNGIGIQPEHHERIFVMFKRLHTREEYEGTGMGLALSKRIVQRHGGRMWVESTPGQGSTFWFTLPDATAAQPAANDPPQRAA